MRKNLALSLLALLLMSVSLAACGNTWEGLKEDTGDNVDATGEKMQDLAN